MAITYHQLQRDDNDDDHDDEADYDGAGLLALLPSPHDHDDDDDDDDDEEDEADEEEEEEEDLLSEAVDIQQVWAKTRSLLLSSREGRPLMGLLAAILVLLLMRGVLVKNDDHAMSLPPKTFDNHHHQQPTTNNNNTKGAAPPTSTPPVPVPPALVPAPSVPTTPTVTVTPEPDDQKKTEAGTEKDVDDNVDTKQEESTTPSTPLLSPLQAVIQQTATSLVKVFPVWADAYATAAATGNHSHAADAYAWCLDLSSSSSTSNGKDDDEYRITDRHAQEGFFYVKVPKCASSTGAGVTERTVDTLGRRLLSGSSKNNNDRDQEVSSHKKCAYRNHHAKARKFHYYNRHRAQSFLWTTIRHPAKRGLSDYFFFHVSRNGETATEESILHHLQTNIKPNYIMEYIRLETKTTHKKDDDDDDSSNNDDDDDDEKDTMIDVIAEILQGYDFISIVERMTESIVVFAMLTRIPLADVVTLSSKQTGGYDDGGSAHGCVMIVPKWTTPAIDEYLATDFVKRHQWDFILYQAANKSLDLTIDALGRDVVEANIAEYKALVAQNEQACEDVAVFPCPATHGDDHAALTAASCYFSDIACGHECTDAALKDYSDAEWAALNN